MPLKRFDASSKRHHITPAQQMLSRIEALKKSQAAKCDLRVATSNVKRDVPVLTNKSVSHMDTLTSSAVASTSHGKRVAHVSLKVWPCFQQHMVPIAPVNCDLKCNWWPNKNWIAITFWCNETELMTVDCSKTGPKTNLNEIYHLLTASYVISVHFAAFLLSYV